MKLFAYCKEETPEISKLLIRIIGTFDGVLDEDENFEVFTSLKAMLPSFANALAQGENIILALDKDTYNADRKKLCAALSLKEEESAQLLDKLLKQKKLTDEERKAHAKMPVGATVFATDTGLYSGFVVEKGQQSIFFFPLEDKSLKTILKSGVSPWLMERALQQKEKAKENVAIESTEEPEEYIDINALPTLDSNDVLQKTLALLEQKEQTVAVSGTPGTEPLKALGENNAKFQKQFVFTPHMEDKGEYNLTDYAALLAKSAKELSGTTYGASVSEIGTGDGGDFICITVADDKTALVRKIYREDDEPREEFSKDAAEELLELIYEKASGKGGVGIEVANPNGQETTAFAKTAGGKILITFLCLLLAAVITVGSLFFVQKRKEQEQQEIAAQTVQTTLETTTVKIEEPVIETVSLSKLMYREMIEGVKEVPAETQTQNNAGTAIDTSENAKPTSEIPKEIIVNGITMDAKEAVARIVEAEMGNTYREDALKAQAILVYTYLKYRDTNWKITGVTLADNYSDEVYNAVRSIFGEYLAFEDKPAFAPYFRLSAGKTSAADAIYQKSLPYLRPVDSMTDKNDEAYKTELILPADEVKTMLTAYDAELVIPENPKEWMKVEKHSAAVNNNIGYVETMTVCGKEMSGLEFVQKVFAGKNIPSTCFEITFNKTTNEFKITAFGDGLGVGMSQVGADKMAATGSNYVQILAKFFPGTKVTA